eukprot:MONOS_10322.1-p1 / transcript=MONOS_10322.1 / gene=MONOS_10322 / organism=Monocercomonoides_exilis_PA203 / gene_product=unspecified product / transcript_product=unspecified product / location=Mono_scaffold00464:35174-35781(+) / protein_length=168 / sequence_SO=supercontig / SO=protein_coding / is_pseudo=false
MRLELQEQIEELKARVSERTTNEKIKKIQSKYRGVKFVELRKVQKRLEQLKRYEKDFAAERVPQLKQETALPVPQTEAECHQLISQYKDYELYIKNYPQTQKYRSLFPSQSMTEQELKEREEFTKKIIQQIKASLSSQTPIQSIPAETKEKKAKDSEDSFAKDDDFFL